MSNIGYCKVIDADSNSNIYAYDDTNINATDDYANIMEIAIHKGIIKDFSCFNSSNRMFSENISNAHSQSEFHDFILKVLNLPYQDDDY